MQDDTVNFISHGLYMIIKRELGSEDEVKQRREGYEIEDVIFNCSVPRIRNTSGSKAEGLNMKSSDIDWMIWDRNVTFVETNNQIYDIQSEFDIIMLIDTSVSSPGFALLLVGQITGHNSAISYSLIDLCNCRYLSSMKFRDYWHKMTGYDTHGPCVSNTLLQSEFDYAYCLHSPFWPSQARGCIQRLYASGWPSRDTVRKIVKNGCNVVPISSKTPRFSEATDMEWRLSFSLAEKSLIHAMNHHQFLCYGLLKMFLNEVIKETEGIEDLLCSYFLKTAMFWEITESRSAQINCNILFLFWNSLRRIISWVNVGYCPNFFIPENNMFSGKIEGQNQELLLHNLYIFYNEGYSCLLRCRSVSDAFSTIVQYPMSSSYIFNANEHSICRETLVFENIKTVYQCSAFGIPVFDVSNILTVINRLLQTKATSLLMENAIQFKFRECMQLLAESVLLAIQSQQSSTPRNIIKSEAMRLKAAFKLLVCNVTTVGSSDIICSKILYSFGNHRKSLRKALSAKHQLQQSDIMYPWYFNINSFVRYNGQNMSIVEFINKHFAGRYFTTEETCIDELKLEVLVAQANIRPVFIPPLVMTNFLLVLNYYALNDTIRRDNVIGEMEVLILYDNRHHIHFFDRAISWEILGICHQMCNNYPRAYQCFLAALNDDYNRFKQATILRIQSLWW